MKKRWHMLVWMWLFLTASSAQAGNIPELVTDRPDFTESSEVVPIGFLQLEAGSTFDWNSSGSSLAVGEVLFRIGLGHISELRLGVNSYSLGFGSTLSHGMEDSSLGFKIKLLNGRGAIPVTALIVETSLPTGNNGSVAGLQPGFKLCLAWDLNTRLALGVNLNYAWQLDGLKRFHELSGSMSLGIGLTENWGVYVEYFTFVPIESGGASHFLNGGVTWLLTPSTQLDLRAGGGLADGSPAVFVGVGISWRK